MKILLFLYSLLSLHLNSYLQILMNTGYLVYKTGEEYTFKGKKIKIQENELLVAILKENLN